VSPPPGNIPGNALARRAAPPPVGSLAWERAGGPPLSLGQKLSTLGGAAGVVCSHVAGRIWSRLRPMRRPDKVDLARWSPPDTRAAREAEQYLRAVSSEPMVHHSLRTYYFSGIVYELSRVRHAIDREALYVAALMHDVGLFETPRPPNEHCFTVGGAREARRIATEAGWDDARQDRMAVAITTNLNARVPIEELGVEAHFMRAGGLVEVLAQEWKVHPDNIAEILARHPRDGFAADALVHVAREAEHNPGGRFACLDPLFPMMVRRAVFRQERHPR
jgi:HD domain